jgi:hypothetical protein
MQLNPGIYTLYRCIERFYPKTRRRSVLCLLYRKEILKRKDDRMTTPLFLLETKFLSSGTSRRLRLGTASRIIHNFQLWDWFIYAKSVAWLRRSHPSSF